MNRPKAFCGKSTIFNTMILELLDAIEKNITSGRNAHTSRVIRHVDVSYVQGMRCVKFLEKKGLVKLKKIDNRGNLPKLTRKGKSVKKHLLQINSILLPTN